MKKNENLYVLATGGTGGHLFPAISIAEILKKNGKIVYLYTDERTFDKTNPKNFDKVYINYFKPRSKILNNSTKITNKNESVFLKKSKKTIIKLIFLKNLLLCGAKSFLNFIKARPRVVVGFGGYCSAPVVFAAQLLRIKTIIHECNCILGRANIILSHLATGVTTGFENVLKLKRSKQIWIGNPVRKEIAAIFNKGYVPHSEKEAFEILVIGGSQGAEVFSKIIPPTIIELAAQSKRDIKVFQQVRPEFLQEVNELYRKSKVQFALCPFFTNMPELLSNVDVVISRSGASTISELAIAGIPSILVPYPNSFDGDQLYNAQFYQSAGAAFLLKEKDMTVKKLLQLLSLLLQNSELLARMSIAARATAIENADERMFKELIKLSQNRI